MIRLDTHAAVAVNAPQLDDRGDPAGQLIVVALDGAGGLVGTVRYPLPDPPSPDVTVRIAARLMMANQGEWLATEQCVIAVYGPVHLAGPVVTLAATTLAHIGVAVNDVVRVHDGRVWCLLECEPGCPADTPEGEPVDTFGPEALPAMTELHEKGATG